MLIIMVSRAGIADGEKNQLPIIFCTGSSVVEPGRVYLSLALLAKIARKTRPYTCQICAAGRSLVKSAATPVKNTCITKA